MTHAHTWYTPPASMESGDWTAWCRDCGERKPEPMTILAVDPGSYQSAFVELRDGSVGGKGIIPNHAILALCRRSARVVMETIEPWGGFTGPRALETMEWVGRFREAVEGHDGTVTIMTRSEVLRALGIGRLPKGQAQAAVRALLIERWGGGNPAQRSHPLHGVTTDMWSALAVAVASVG